ncbi:MAG: hypothetical protein V4857_22380 [Pseudomonadota bacterium]
MNEFTPKNSPGLMDQAFKAKYRVLQLVYGTYAGRIIEFDAYDHYGRPPFEAHRTVLLFVSRHEGRLYHEKYQYFPVFKTATGDWAGCGSPYQHESEMHHKALRPRALKFGADAYFDMSQLSQKQIAQSYPSTYFRIQGNRAYCVEGNLAAELFEVKRDGVLTARGLFGKGT